jgi:hypothetical protein
MIGAAFLSNWRGHSEFPHVPMGVFVPVVWEKDNPQMFSGWVSASSGRYLLLDFAVPKHSGLEALRDLSAGANATPVRVVTLA